MDNDCPQPAKVAHLFQSAISAEVQGQAGVREEEVEPPEIEQIIAAHLTCKHFDGACMHVKNWSHARLGRSLQHISHSSTAMVPACMWSSSWTGTERKDSRPGKRRGGEHLSGGH